MRKITLISFMLLATIGFSIAGDYPVRGEGGKKQAFSRDSKKADVVRVAPHLAVNEEWVSELTIRSDSDSPIFMVLEFYDADGFPVEAVFYDSNNEQYSGEGFIIEELLPYEIYSLDFESLAGTRNMQVHVLTNEFEQDYGLEAAYYRFFRDEKITSVGVPIQPPGDLFVVNADQRFDPYTGNKRYRGIALSNVDGLNCNCNVKLYNRFGDNLDNFGLAYPEVSVDIPAFGKWIGDVYALFPNIDTHLQDSLGYLEFSCDNPVSVLALSFEANTPIATSVPVEYFDIQKTKDGKTKRIKR